MKRFHIDIESADSSRYQAGLTEVFCQVTVSENADHPDTSVLNMSENTMRRLHKMLGSHIRHIDEAKTGT